MGGACGSRGGERNSHLVLVEQPEGKGKVHPRTGYEGPEGSRGIVLLFL
jgi:hypothetical protein